MQAALIAPSPATDPQVETPPRSLSPSRRRHARRAPVGPTRRFRGSALCINSQAVVMGQRWAVSAETRSSAADRAGAGLPRFGGPRCYAAGGRRSGGHAGRWSRRRGVSGGNLGQGDPEAVGVLDPQPAHPMTTRNHRLRPARLRVTGRDLAGAKPPPGTHHRSDSVCRYVGHIAGSPSTGPGRQGGDHDVVYVGMRKAVRATVVLEGGDHPALGLDRREPAEARVLQELERRIVS